MKKTFSALLVFSLIINSSCKKVDELTEFDIPYSTKQTLPASGIPVGGTADFTTPDVQTDSQAKFAANSTAKDLISSVTMSKFSITNETGNLDFLRSFTVYINADGLGEVQVASKALVPDGVSMVEADVTGASIKEHIFKDKFRLRMTVSVDSLPAQEQQLKIDQVAHVSGKKLSKKK